MSPFWLVSGDRLQKQQVWVVSRDAGGSNGFWCFPWTTQHSSLTHFFSPYNISYCQFLPSRNADSLKKLFFFFLEIKKFVQGQLAGVEWNWDARLGLSPYKSLLVSMMLSASEIQGLLVFINVKKSLIHPSVQESPIQYPNWWPSSLSEPYPWWEITHCWPSVLSMSDTFWLTHRAPGGSKNIAFRNTVLLVSWDCCTKSPHTGWLQTAESSSLTVLEARDP